MFKFIISFLFIAIIHGIECPDDQYSYKGECIANTCKPFIEKLISTKKPSGSRFIPISFNGTIIKRSEYYFELTFDDDQEGTFHRDNNQSCIIDELYIHQLNYLDGVKNNTNITSSYVKNQRKWTFNIGNLSTLYIDYQKDKSIYNGYYSLRFFVGSHLQLMYMFDFQLIFNLDDSLIETHVHSQILDDKEACTIFNICSQFLQSEIHFCKNETCFEFIEETPKLFLNKSLFFEQKLEVDFYDWYLHDIEITFQGNQMVKKFRPFYEKPQEGSTQARIIPTFISGPGTLYFAAKVSQTNFWGRRALQQQIGSPVSLAKVDIACIAKTNHSECPTDAEIQEYNELDCGDVDLMYCESGNILLVGLLIWLI